LIRYPDEISEKVDVNGYLDVDYLSIQSKRSASFSTSALRALGDVAERLIRGRAIASDNERVRAFAQLTQRIVEQARYFRNRKPRAVLAYITTGLTPDNDANFIEAEQQIKTRLLETQLIGSVEIELLGADAILQLHRQASRAVTRTVTLTRKVTVAEVPGVSESYLGVLPVREFFKLIEGENGKILPTIFYDNVRDYQFMNEVNAGIAASLSDLSGRQRFVLMNNGVTMIAKRVVIAGDKVTLENYQIVNGCQTSHVLWETRSIEGLETVHVPVKIVATSDEEIIADIIRATNSQTSVSRIQLLSATEFQKTLEDCFSAFDNPGLRYERRSHQYTGVNIQRSKIVSQIELIKSFAAVFSERPHLLARGFKGILGSVGVSIFKREHKPEPYLYCAVLVYWIELLLRRGKLPRTIGPLRYHLALAFHRLQADRPASGLESQAAQRFALRRLKRLDTAESAFDALQPAVELIDGVCKESRNIAPRTEPFTRAIIAAAARS
nr:AIPR family protein [Burkholderiales bacterium]